MIDDLEKLSDLISTPQSLSEDMQVALGTWIANQQIRAEALKEPFKWLYCDLTDLPSLQFNFLNALGMPIYNAADYDALACTTMTIWSKQINNVLVPHWINAVLKTIDHIVVHYIQDYLKQPFNNSDSLGVESSRYKQLEKMEEPMKSAGVHLYGVYVYRNKTEHRTIKDGNGRTILIKPNYKIIKKNAMNSLPVAFKSLLNGYKLAYPQHIES